MLDTDSVLQPQMQRAKSITKLVDPKDVTDKKFNKYVLTTQEQVFLSFSFEIWNFTWSYFHLLQDSAGEIETKLYKGDVYTTVGGGAQVAIRP